jgi:hypothetical protein
VLAANAPIALAPIVKNRRRLWRSVTSSGAVSMVSTRVEGKPKRMVPPFLRSVNMLQGKDYGIAPAFPREL